MKYLITRSEYGTPYPAFLMRIIFSSLIAGIALFISRGKLLLDHAPAQIIFRVFSIYLIVGTIVNEYIYWLHIHIVDGFILRGQPVLGAVNVVLLGIAMPEVILSVLRSFFKSDPHVGLPVIILLRNHPSYILLSAVLFSVVYYSICLNYKRKYAQMIQIPIDGKLKFISCSKIHFIISTEKLNIIVLKDIVYDVQTTIDIRSLSDMLDPYYFKKYNGIMLVNKRLVSERCILKRLEGLDA